MSKNSNKLDHIISLALCEGDKREYASFMDIDDSDVVIPAGEIKKLKRAVSHRFKRESYARARKILWKITVAAMLIMSLTFVALMSISATREAIFAVFSGNTDKCEVHKPSAAPTCTAAQVCTVCGEELAAPLPHTPGVEATCTSPQVCTVCNTQVTAALGHTEGAVATCTSPQLCTVCNIQLSPKAVHIASGVATCTEGQTCLICNRLISPPKGHVPGPEATCKSPQSCTVCGEILAQTFVHTRGEMPTCTMPQTCTVCDKVILEAKGHVPRNPVKENIVRPTCVRAGTYDSVVYCHVCSMELSREQIVIEELAEHTTVDNSCSVCEQLICSEGLDLVLHESGNAYVLRGIGSCTDETVYVGTYNNLPVITITSSFKGASIKKLIVGDTVTSMSMVTVIYSPALTELYIGKGVTSITDTNLDNVSNLKSVTVSEENPSYSSLDGHLYNKDQTVLLRYSAGCTDTEFNVPGSVKSIANYAFKNNVYLKHVIIGDSVVSIGNLAFNQCEALESVTVGNSVTDIGYSAFSNCTSLSDVTLGTSVERIGDNVFFNCSSLKTIQLPDRLEQIPQGMFSNCTSLSSIEIPSSVTSIGEWAFANCSELESIVIGGSVETIGNYAFEECLALKSVTLSEGLKRICDDAFNGCRELKSISLPEGVTYIANGAFASTGLTEITIPGTVTYVGADAFSTKYLTEAIFSEGIEEIDLNFFGTSPIRKISIPASVKVIERYNFSDYGSIEYITVADGNETYSSINGDLYTGDGKKLIKYSAGKSESTVIIPDGVEIIGESAFDGATEIFRVVLSDTVTSIEQKAFRHCHNLVSVTLGEALTSIGYDAFYGCNHLAEVINRSQLTVTVGNGSHGGVAHYAVEVHNGESGIIIEDGYVLYSGVNENYLVRYTGNETVINLPESINGETYAIMHNAFEILSGVERINLSDGVTKICEKAFTVKAKNLVIYIPDTVVTIKNNGIYYSKYSTISSLTILCEAEEIPYEWYPYSAWLSDAEVVWGYTDAETE